MHAEPEVDLSQMALILPRLQESRRGRTGTVKVYADTAERRRCYGNAAFAVPNQVCPRRAASAAQLSYMTVLS